MKTKKNKLIKRTIKIVMALTICSLYSCYYVYRNFATYCVYYAKHIPHAKDSNPEMVMILDYLDDMGESSIKGLRYDTDGYNVIIKDENFALRNKSFNNSAQYELSFYNNYHTYLFDAKGKFISYWYLQSEEDEDGTYETSDIRKQEAQAYVDEVINPIVEKMAVKPTVNLQWLFNKKYQERFSDD